MMKALKKMSLPNLLAVVVLLAASSSGCAHKNRNLWEESAFHQVESAKELHLRKESASRGIGTPKELPDMTCEEHERLGDVHFSRGDLGTAFVQYDEALKLDPDNSRIHHKKGLLLVIGRMNEDAIREFQEVLKKEPKNALSHEGLGLAFFQMKKYDDAEECFRKAVELAPRLWKAHNFLGIIYDYKMQYEMAVCEYEAAIALKDDDGLLYNNLGTSYFLAGEYQKALNAFDKALATKTTHSKIYNNLGFVLSDLGRYQEALEAFRKGGGEAQAYNNLGCIYLEHGKYKEAIRCFEKAIELKPTFYTKASENLRKARVVRESSFDSNVQTSFDDGIPKKRSKLTKDLDKASGEPLSPESLMVEKLKIWREPESDSVKLQLRLRNVDPHGRRIKGYIFVVLKPEIGSQEPLRSFPSTRLKDGRPKQFKKGAFFSIARFRFVHGTLPDIEAFERFKTATVYVYSETGSLLSEKIYEVNDILFWAVSGGRQASEKGLNQAGCDRNFSRLPAYYVAERNLLG